MNASPAAVTSSPRVTTTRAPNRVVNAALIGENTMMPIAIGMNRTPVSRALRPWTPWRYWLRKKSAPIRLKKASVTDRLAAVKRGLRNRRTSSIGSATRRSHQTKVTSVTAETANAVRTKGLAHPFSGISMIAHTSETRPITDSTAPAGSSATLPGARDSGTMASVARMPTMTNGTLTRKTDVQA